MNILEKIFSKFSGIFSFLATGLKNFKVPFHKKFHKIPEVSEISNYTVCWLSASSYCHTYVFAYMYIRIYVYMYVCMYMYVCIPDHKDIS